MAVALTVTLLAIIVTGFGCFALNGDPFTLRFTAWGVSHTRFGNVSAMDAYAGQIAYIGLRRFVVKKCSSANNRDWYFWSQCSQETIWWTEASCEASDTSYYGYPCDAMETCQDAALNNQVGAYMVGRALLLSFIVFIIFIFYNILSLISSMSK